MSDAVRVGLNRFVLYAFIGKALEELIEPTDGKRNPAGTCVRRVRLDEQRGVFVDVPKDLVPDAEVRGSPEEARVPIDAGGEVADRHAGDEVGDRALHGTPLK